MSLLKKLAGETAWYGLSSILGRFLNVMLVPLYTNTLSKAQYGVVTDFYANSAFLMVLYSYRMESAFFRYGADEAGRQKAYSTSVFSVLCTSLLLLLGVWVFAQPIADMLQYPEHPEYVRYFGLILAFDCLAELPFARLRLEQRPIRFASIKMFWIGLNVSLNLFWLLACPWAYAHGMHWVTAVWVPGLGVGYIFISNAIASLAAMIWLLPELRKAFQSTFDLGLWKKMMVYALPLVLVSMAGVVNEMLDRAILKYLLPGTRDQNLAQVGEYGANYKLAMLISLFTQAYRYAAEPFFFRTAKNQDAHVLQAKATKWFTITTLCGMLGILLFIDLVKYFIGAQFWGGLGIVPILLLANVLLGLYYNFSVWYRLMDKTAIGAWISVGGALVTIVLNLVFVPQYSYWASAWATLACYAFMSWATWFSGRKVYPVPYPLGRMGLYAGVTLGLYALSIGARALGLHPILMWGVNIALFAVYPLVVYRLERKELGGLLGRQG
ncbi:MAG: oligosaccharide flippase family protein [Bacteroidota bacterium]